MAVNTAGDIEPAALPGLILNVDQDGDFFSDVISPGGNTIDTSLVGDSFDPDTPTEWDHEMVWRHYEDPWDIRIGEASQGSMTINGGSAIRVEEIEIGEDGHGQITVTGFGSVLNNDRNIIDDQFKGILEWSLSQVVANYDPDDMDYTNMPGVSARKRGAGDFNCRVGINGTGVLVVTAGGKAEVRNKLTVAEVTGSSGLVVVGNSSSLWVTGSAAGSTVGDGGRLILEYGGVATFGRSGDDGGTPAILNTALTIDGVLEVRDGNSTIHAQKIKIGANGLLRIRERATLTITGELENDGQIILDAGAELIVVGTKSGTGIAKRFKCGPAAIYDGVPSDGALEIAD